MLRNEVRKRRQLRRRTAIVLLATIPSLIPAGASAEDFFSFLFGGAPKQQRPAANVPQTTAFADPFAAFAPPAAPKPVVSGGSRSGYCVRTCDGRYFPITARGNVNAAQMCQAFCPASATRIYSGGNIDTAISSSGERYADSDSAFAYRKALKSDCTCNGRDPVGLAPVDLTFDSTLKAGDVVATSDGLMAYTGIRLGAGQAADFTPVASYPGLTASVRAKLGEMKVAPVTADVSEDNSMPASETATSISTVTETAKVISLRERRDTLN